MIKVNTYYFNDDSFKKTDIYKDFISEYPASGNLRIRAYAASGAVPLSDIDVTIYKEYNNVKIIFYEGKTDESGLIENIILPAPELSSNMMDIPSSITYEISVISKKDDISKVYQTSIYENIYVVQNINVIPKTTYRNGDIYGS